MVDSNKIPIAFLLSLLLFFTLLGNTFVLVVLLGKLRQRLLKKPLYIFICNICLANILATLFTMTFEVAEELQREWEFGEAACKAIEYLEMTLFGVNIFTHLSIAFERYRKVVEPLKPTMTIKMAKILVAVSWTIPSVISLPYIYTLRVTAEINGKPICTVVEMPWVWVDKFFLTIELLGVFLVPLACIVWMYVIIVKRLYERRRELAANVVASQPTQTTMRAAATHGSRVAIAVVTVFVICWLPFVVVYFVRLFRGTESVNRTSPLYVTALYASFSSELLTPMLYCAFDSNIKPTAIDILLCRQRVAEPKDETASCTVGSKARCTIILEPVLPNRPLSAPGNCGIV